MLKQYLNGSRIFLLFFIFTLIGFIYTITTGVFNGDFIGTRCTIDLSLLVINLLISVIPFLLGFLLYVLNKRMGIFKKRSILITENDLFPFLIWLIVWHIFVTIAYDVGVMGKPMYNAPSFISPVIQLFNRLNPMVIGLIYIYVSNNFKKTLFVISLLIFLCLLRAGLGAIMFIQLTLLIRYWGQIKSWVKKHLLLVCIVSLFVPLTVDVMYAVRSYLRSDSGEFIEHSDLSSFGQVFGKLAGRLSSFSNSGILLQYPEFYGVISQSLDRNYFLQLSIAGLLGANYAPDLRPEEMMIKSVAPNAENVSYMTGTQGNLIISLFLGFDVFWGNLLLIILLSFIYLYTARFLNFAYSFEFTFLNLCYCLMSGVANEFSFYISINIAFIIVYYIYIQTIKKITSE